MLFNNLKFIIFGSNRMSALVIVESPGKIKKIQQYLDSLWPQKYEVAASYGHVCDLPLVSLGFDSNTFEGVYEVGEDKKRVVQNLKAITKRSNDVILAMDNDREGEAIAHHLCRVLQLRNPDRILFNEITKSAIEKAMKSPQKINQKKVDAQETRRILDRMIGWLVSPMARNYVVPGSSMGRVQTVIILIIVLLERAIKQFVSVKHYSASLIMLNNERDPAAPWSASWDIKTWLKPGEKYWLDRQAVECFKNIKTLVVDEINISEATNSPSAPLITSTLQRAAEVNLNLTPDETMALAQKLYEAGVITYMRTDNANLSAEAFILLKNYATSADLPVESNQRMFSTKKNAQEAHEAIRPTSFNLLKVGEGKIQDLYEMIWNRAVASQLKAAKYDTKEVVLSQSIDVVIDGVSTSKKVTFKAKGRRLVFAGWRELNNKSFTEIEEDDQDENEGDLSNLIPEKIKIGDSVDVKDFQLLEKNTEAPRRFTAAGLIAELERSGIGRPSTYSSLMTAILKKNFIRYEKKKIFATEIGTKIIDEMEKHFGFIDVEFTALMEEELDSVESGEKPFRPILRKFWDDINSEISAFEKHIITTLPQHKCEECQSLVLKRSSKTGVYWKCSNGECNAMYSDNNNKPGIQKVNKVTTFKCIECDRPLNYSKGSFKGADYEGFSCTGRNDEQNNCAAKYVVIANSKPPTPNFELYKEQTKHKCLVCKRPVLKKSKEKDGVKSFFWMCSGYRKEASLCSTFYEDMHGEPDYAAFELNHKFNCTKCGNFLSRRKNRVGDGYFWKCGHPIGKDEKCVTYYEDKDKAPDFEKFQKDYELNHTYKCLVDSCDHFLTRKKYREQDKHFWSCGGCNSFYEESESKPDFALFKIEYERNHTHKCIADGACGGYLARRYSKGSNSHFWMCAKCDSNYSEKAELPDFEKFKIDHTHKCFSCNGYLYAMTNVTGGKKWKCADKTCAVMYEDIGDQPNYEQAKTFYAHQCPNCKFGKLKPYINTKTKLPQWSCSNTTGCNSYFDDENGVPNLNARKKQKKGSK